MRLPRLLALAKPLKKHWLGKQNRTRDPLGTFFCILRHFLQKVIARDNFYLPERRAGVSVQNLCYSQWIIDGFERHGSLGWTLLLQKHKKLMDLTTLCPEGTKVAVGRPGASRIIKKALHIVCLLPRAPQRCTLAPKVQKEHICDKKCTFDTKVLFGVRGAEPAGCPQLSQYTKCPF